MQWLHPYGHLAWIGVAAIAALLAWAAVRRLRDRRNFGSIETIDRLADGVDLRLRRVRTVLIVAAAALVAIALAGPRFGSQPREVTRQGLDLVIALDVSASMLAEDVAPSRLERSRNELKRLVNDLQGDRVALVTFAGSAFLQMPLTSDRSAFRLFLDVASPDQIPTPGTDFAEMLVVASAAFTENERDADRSKVLLVVSDGENHATDVDDALKKLRAEGVEIFSVGVGERSGARIPIRRQGRIAEYRRDREGNYVQTRLEDDALRQISGNERYFEIGRASTSIGGITSALERLQRSEMETTVYMDHEERYQWPLALAIVLLLFERLIPDRRRNSDPAPVTTT